MSWEHMTLKIKIINLYNLCNINMVKIYNFITFNIKLNSNFCDSNNLHAFF